MTSLSNGTSTIDRSSGKTSYANWIERIDGISKNIIIPYKILLKRTTDNTEAIRVVNERATNGVESRCNEFQSYMNDVLNEINVHAQNSGVQIRQLPALNINILPANTRDIDSTLDHTATQLVDDLKQFKAMSSGKINGCLIAVLLFFYIIPGIIYAVVVNNKKTKLETAYTELLNKLSYMNQLISLFKETNQRECAERQKTAVYKNHTDISAFKSSIESLLKAEQSAQADFRSSIGMSGLAWDAPEWLEWSPATGLAGISMLGDIRFALDSEHLLSSPLIINFQSGRSMLFKTNQSSKQIVLNGIKSMLLRLLATTRPGCLEFTFIDPLGLGSNVLEFIALGDKLGKLINYKVWSESEHISKRLFELADKVTVINTKYLRDDFESIEDYNQQANEIAEPYHIMLITDFPTNFSDESVKRLLSISKNGPKSGIYPIIIYDTDRDSGHGSAGSSLMELENVSTVFECRGSDYKIDQKRFENYSITFNSMPKNTDLTKNIILAVAENAKKETTVEVPFSRVLQKEAIHEDSWSVASSSVSIEIPIGPTGANKIQSLILDSEMNTNVLVVGRPGSGKGNMAMIIINSLALKYSPLEAQVYLIDMKQGVDYKVFADYKLPHAKVIAIDSDREYALTVIEGLHAEMESRGDVFRRNSVRKIADYRSKTNVQMPRIILMIEEFQKLFTNNDKVSATASRLLESLIREGRNAGIHIFLSTQSLINVSLPKSILDLISVRIAFQCSEAESRIIMTADNMQATFLTRPGEAIYNARGGLIDGNNPFQVAKYDDDEGIGHLSAIKERAQKYAVDSDPIVFMGSNLIDISECPKISSVLDNTLIKLEFPELWLGKPFSVNPNISVSFKNNYGNHLAVIDQSKRITSSILLSSLTSLSLQRKFLNIKIYLISFDDSKEALTIAFNDFSAANPDDILMISRRGLPAMLESQAQKINLAIQGIKVDALDKTIIIIEGIQRVRDLYCDGNQSSDEMTANFDLILREGPLFGIHVIISADSFNSLTKVIDNSKLKEIDYRIIGKSNPQQSNSFTGDMYAAYIEKENRLLLTDMNNPDDYSMFIPYNHPEKEFLDKIISHPVK